MLGMPKRTDKGDTGEVKGGVPSQSTVPLCVHSAHLDNDLEGGGTDFSDPKM